jgi:hypothetical protein
VAHAHLRLVEGLGLVKSISVLGSDNVGVQVTFCDKTGVVEKLCVILEAGCEGLGSIALTHVPVEVFIDHWELRMGVWLGSIQWVLVRLSESSAPILLNAWVRFEESFLSVPSEESRSGLIEALLVFQESDD